MSLKVVVVVVVGTHSKKFKFQHVVHTYLHKGGAFKYLKLKLSIYFSTSM